MPRYPYRCPSNCSLQRYRRGQEYDEIRSIHDQGGEVTDCPECLGSLRRVFTPSHIIMRPDGYSLKPEDAGYWNLNRQAELGQLRGAPEQVQRDTMIDESLLKRPEIEIPELDVSSQREIYELGKIVDRNIRESSDIPELIRED